MDKKDQQSQAPPFKDYQTKSVFVTINNPNSDETHDKIKEALLLHFSTFRYAAFCDEVGEQGTPHTHCLICFDSAVRFSKIKKYFPRAHIDKVHSFNDTLEYIKKTGKWAGTDKAKTSVPGSFEELGDPPPQNAGKNKSLEELYKMVTVEELTNSEIIARNQDYIGMIDTITRLRTTFLQEKYGSTRRLDIKVIYIYGATGTGKSRGILDKHGDKNVYRVTDYQHPFDHYEMQDVIVFEEFRSSLLISDMLKYLDIYPITLPARYASKFACYHHVYFATNIPLAAQYPDVQKDNLETWYAFLRRIHEVQEYNMDGSITTYDSVKDYFKAHGFTPEYYSRTPDEFEEIQDMKDLPFADIPEGVQEELDFAGDKEHEDNEHGKHG